MTRYYSRARTPKCDFYDLGPLVLDIHAPEHKPVDTGLIDERGNAIMRLPNTMGFGREDEW